MAGNKSGGLKAAKTNTERYGSDWYAKIGAKGGKVGGLKGFALNKELASEAGRKGGLKSNKKGALNEQAMEESN